MATEHLIELGHRRIANLAGAVDQLNVRISQGRVAGYREALRAADLEIDPALEVPGAFTIRGGYQATQILLGESFTAVFAGSDLAALGAIRVLRQAGLRVPDDVSVVGFDDIELVQFISPPLTTVRQPATEIAAQATQILLNLIRGESTSEMDFVIEPQLCVRESSSPPAQS